MFLSEDTQAHDIARTRLIESAFLPPAGLPRLRAREKSVRHGHVSTLHVWPARRPPAASRAAVLPVPRAKTSGGGCWRGWRRSCRVGEEDPAEPHAVPGGDRAAFDGRAPRGLDPFAGGGAIPLAAMRLGCEGGFGVERAWLRASYSPMAGRGLPCTIGVPWLPMPAWRSPGWRNASRKEDTASPSPRFAGDSPGDGATSSARTEVRWTNGRWYDNSPAVSRCCRREWSRP